MTPGETRLALVVSAAQAIREGRLSGGVAVLCEAGYGVMVSKAGTLSSDRGTVEVAVCDLTRTPQEAVGEGVGRHVDGALLAALGPLLAPSRPGLVGITGGKGA